MAGTLKKMFAAAEARRVEQSARWVEQRFAEHMADCETAWRAGVAVAVADAVSWCRLYGRPPPAWLDQAVARVVRQRQTKAEKKQRYDAMIHLTRWSAVKELRERKDELAQGGHIARIRSWQQTFEIVAEHLAKTGFSGSADTIEAGYKKVQRDMRNGRRGKYYSGLTHC